MGNQKTGGVAAFKIENDGKLSLLNQQSSAGAGPCHVSVDRSGRTVLVANYGGGSIAALPIQEDGKLGPAATAIQHVGQGVDKRRQEKPHAHSINVDPDNRFVVAADLGLDKVLVYRLDPARAELKANDPPSVSVADGAGPRHFAFHPDGRHAYVINEMHSTVTALAYDLVTHPFRFLRPMHRMLQVIEQFLHLKGEARRMGIADWQHPIYGKPKRIRRFSLLPNKTSFVPQHVPINDEVLKNLLCHADGDLKQKNKEHKKARMALIDETILKEGKKRKRVDRSKGNELRMPLWNRIFDIDATRRKRMEFGFFFTTDGVSVSVLWNSPLKTGPTSKKKRVVIQDPLPSLEVLKGRTVVGVDPGKCSLMYFTSDEPDCERPQKRIDFTSDRYRVESYRRGHRRKLLAAQKPNVKAAESSLSASCGKSSSQQEYLRYAHLRSSVQDLLAEHYSNPKYRVWKWVRYRRKQRCLDNLVNEIRTKFGKDCVLAVGRWGSGNNHLPGRDPTPNIGLRNFLKKHFELHVVPEMYTTRTCSRCKGHTAPPDYEMPSRKPKYNKPEYWREQGIKYVEVHGLRRCQNESCGTHWNRDYNAAKNIRENFLHLVEHGTTHPSFSRKAIIRPA